MAAKIAATAHPASPKIRSVVSIIYPSGNRKHRRKVIGPLRLRFPLLHVAFTVLVVLRRGLELPLVVVAEHDCTTPERGKSSDVKPAPVGTNPEPEHLLPPHESVQKLPVISRPREPTKGLRAHHEQPEFRMFEVDSSGDPHPGLTQEFHPRPLQGPHVPDTMIRPTPPDTPGAGPVVSHPDVVVGILVGTLIDVLHDSYLLDFVGDLFRDFTPVEDVPLAISLVLVTPNLVAEDIRNAASLRFDCLIEELLLIPFTVMDHIVSLS